jgi:hypothetical protein
MAHQANEEHALGTCFGSSHTIAEVAQKRTGEWRNKTQQETTKTTTRHSSNDRDQQQWS